MRVRNSVAVKPDSKEIAYDHFESRSLSVRERRRYGRYGRRDGAWAGAQRGALSKTDAAESLSPCAGLAVASGEHERTERHEMGRSHPCARRTERQHLGLSSLLQRQARWRRDVPESR